MRARTHERKIRVKIRAGIRAEIRAGIRGGVQPQAVLAMHATTLPTSRTNSQHKYPLPKKIAPSCARIKPRSPIAQHQMMLIPHLFKTLHHVKHHGCTMLTSYFNHSTKSPVVQHTTHSGSLQPHYPLCRVLCRMQSFSQTPAAQCFCRNLFLL